MRWQDGTFLVGEKGLDKSKSKSLLPQTRLARSWLDEVVEVLLRILSSRRLLRLRKCKRKRQQYCNNTKNKRTKFLVANRTTCSFPPSYPSSFLFCVTPRRLFSAPCLLACKSTWNQFDQSCSSRIRCATCTFRERRSQKTHSHPKSNHIPFLVYTLVQTAVVSIIKAFINRSSVKRTMMMMLPAHQAGLWPCCQRRAQALLSYPCRSSQAIPEPVILVLKSVRSARPAQEPRPR
jgi:hypothetical protein